MSDDITKIASSDGDSKTDEKARQTSDKPTDDWKSITGGKYKSETELATAYKELETKLGQSSEEVRKTREFAESIQPLLEVIRNDPELFSKIDSKLRSQGQPNTNQANGENQVDDTREATREIIRLNFEKAHGIDKLSSDEQKNIRAKMGDFIFSLTGKGFKDVDLHRLNDLLENSYVLANKDKLVEQSKLEALAEARKLEEGSISSLTSSSEKGQATLTPEEAKTASRLGLTGEQYIEGKKVPAKK